MIAHKHLNSNINHLNTEFGSLNSADELKQYICDSFRDLYKERDVGDGNWDDLLADVPKLATAQAANLSRELTVGELRSALKGIKDSCPGLGGIPYSLYAVLHIQLLPLIADCWNYSKSTGRLPATQNLSCINLIPKKDKDLKQLKNWNKTLLTMRRFLEPML